MGFSSTLIPKKKQREKKTKNWTQKGVVLEARSPKRSYPHGPIRCSFSPRPWPREVPVWHRAFAAVSVETHGRRDL